MRSNLKLKFGIGSTPQFAAHFIFGLKLNWQIMEKLHPNKELEISYPRCLDFLYINTRLKQEILNIC